MRAIGFSGMVKQETSLCMMVAVPDCTMAVLLPIIIQHVCLGTCIITVGWHMYNQLPQHNDEVNHWLNFVDPNNPILLHQHH